MAYALILVLHILISILLVAVVLLQTGRGGGLAGAFGGGGGNQTLFGGRGATSFLTKATWILGTGFMLTSLALALTIGNRRGPAEQRSLLRDTPIEAPAATQPLSSPGATQEQAPPPTNEPVPGPSGE